MAKQAGNIFIEGTIDDLTYYKMEGRYYVRMKSSFTKKKFWKSSAFEGSRQSCKRFAEGNKLASKLYGMIAEEKRVYKLFCFLKKKAILLLKEGKSIVEAEDLLTDYLRTFRVVGKTDNTKCVKGITVDTKPLVLKETKKGCVVYRYKALECTIDDGLFKENRKKMNLAHSFP